MEKKSRIDLGKKSIVVIASVQTMLIMQKGHEITYDSCTVTFQNLRIFASRFWDRYTAVFFFFVFSAFSHFDLA